MRTSFVSPGFSNFVYFIFAEANVEVTMDLSNRPCLTENLTLADCAEEYVGDSWTVEMFEHVLESLVMNGHMTVHIVELTAGKTVKETAMATAMAFGRVLRFCAAVDPRRAGKTASSKGTLSV
jgi:imidazoleglycerol-phosphate dehydratase